MSPTLNEVKDEGPDGAPTIEQMRESQKRGSVGIGLNEQSYNDDLRDNNQAPNGEDDTTPSGTPSLPWLR